MVSPPDTIIMPFSDVKATAPSSCVIDPGFEHTSLLIGCLVEYVPSEDTSIAQIPSVENTNNGNCPNCPVDIGLVVEVIPRILPTPTVFIPFNGK